jgi:hypothetical protein
MRFFPISKYLGSHISRHLIDSKRARVLTSELHIKEQYARMEQSINPHAYCRLRFDEAAEEAIENLANVLQWHRNSVYEGLFVAQKDARAGTSRTNTRVKILSLNNQSFLLYLSLCVCVFSLCFESERAKKNVVILSLSLSPRVRLRASFLKNGKRERERWKIFSRSVALSFWEKEEFGEISFR